VTGALGITVYGCEPDEADRFHARAPRFGIVPTTTSAAVAHSTIGLAAGNRCISIGHKSALTGDLLRGLREAGVEHVSTRSIGFDHIDLGAAAAAGIAVRNVVYDPDGVADFTLMLILMLIRDTISILDAVGRRDFRLGRVRGGDLRDLTVGVVGAGHIGRAVVRRLEGFGGRVLAYSKRRDPTVAADFVDLDVLLRESDVVTLHVPLNAETHHLVGRAQLASMKTGALLVNTGRGALVDTAALVTALERGELGGAALDVVENEEGIFYRDRTASPVDDPNLGRLLRLPNVIVTPHTAYYTARALHDTVERTLAGCLEFERRRAHGATEGPDLVRGPLGGA
jgi:D-specific alpha-keto acid dehydrogenase